MTYCNGETSIIRPDLTSPGAYLTLFLGESLISQPSGEVHTSVWSQAFMGPVGHSDPLYEGSPMEADSFGAVSDGSGEVILVNATLFSDFSDIIGNCHKNPFFQFYISIFSYCHYAK